MDLGNVTDIVRTEVRQRYRALRQNDSQFLLIVLAGLFFALLLFPLLGFAYVLGSGISGGSEAAYDGARTGVAIIFAVTLVFVGIRALNGKTGLTAGDSVLLATTHREAVLAYLLIEGALIGLPVGVVAVLVAVALGAGAGSVALIGLGVVVALSVVALGAGTGVALALAGRAGVARYKLLARLKGPLVALGLAAYFAVIFASNSQGVYQPVYDAIAATPVGWYADLVLLGTVPVSPLRAAGAVVLTVGGLLGVVAVADRLASALWYAAPVDSGSSTAGSWLPSVPTSDPAAAAITRKTWLRALRSPARLVYALYGVLAAGFFLVQALRGDGSQSLVVAVAVSGAWAAGVAFTLNPIGEQSAVLPLTLTSRATGRSVVAGRWLASTAFGVPLTVALVGIYAVITGFSVADTVVFTALGAVLAALAPGVAVGIGAAFPSMETTEIIGSYEVVTPSLGAFVLYSVTLSVATVPAWLTPPGIVRTWAADGLGTDPTVVSLGSATVAVVVVAGCSLYGFRSAARSVEGYTYG